MLFGGFRITATSRSPTSPTACSCAMGDWNGGYALFVVDGVASSSPSAGPATRSRLLGDRPVPDRSPALGVSYVLGATATAGTFTLLDGDAPVGRLAFDGMLPLAIQHGGAGCGSATTSASRSRPATAAGPVERSTSSRSAPDARRTATDPAEEVRAALHGD